jgi:acyl-CoA synthetase (AMP-forming)/AMP-acid ligase II
MAADLRTRRLPRNIGEVLERPLAGDPDREALIASDSHLSYAELDAAAERAAANLYKWGLRRGDRVAVSMPNTSHIVVLFHAVMRLGGIWVGLNTNLAPPEKRFILGNSGSSFLLATPEVLDGIDDPGPDRIKFRPIGPGASEFMDTAARDSYPRPVDLFDAPAGIAYTSGTTGRPKGVVHSHRNLLLPGAVLAADRGYDSTLRRGDCAALTILNLQVTSTLLTAQAGGTQVVMDRVDPEGIAEWIRRESVNSWFGVPTLLHGLATSDRVVAEDLQSLEDVWTGGTELPPPIRTAFEEKFGRRVYATYGLTEVPTVVSIEPRGITPRPESSGRVLPHLEIRIDTPDGPDGYGQEGELLVSGRPDGEWGGLYRPMLGYHPLPSRPDHPGQGEPLRTGDIGVIDRDSYLYVRGRSTSLIIRGGSNVYPAEVERAILEVPGVNGVAVVGIPDERLGQRIGAAIELVTGVEADPARIHDHCRAALARYKVPDQWLFRPLPRNAMGKVVRPEVESWFL